MGASASQQPGDYQEPTLPKDTWEIRISVYKLQLTGIGIVDAVGSSLAGAYHSGLVVDGREWAYGSHDCPGKSGVYSTRPEENDQYTFYQRVVVGNMRAPREEVLRRIRKIARSEKWTGVNYDMIELNCNHFVSDLCWELMRRRSPAWINGTAETIGLARRRSRVEASALDAALAAYHEAMLADAAGAVACNGVTPEGGACQLNELGAEGTQLERQSARPPGLQAFQDAFSATFRMSWDRNVAELQADAERRPEGEDPDAHRERALQGVADVANRHALATATVVASAARAAAAARAAVPVEGLAAWDVVWARESAKLLRAWREEGIAGILDARLDSEQGQVREDATAAALAAASAAASEAARRAADRGLPALREPLDPERPAAPEVNGC